MENIIVRQARYEDIDKIIAFIKDHYYIKNQVFTRKRELFFEWHVYGHDVWFIIGEGCESGQIYGILGYTLYTPEDNMDVSATMFQVIKSSDPSLGMRLMMYARELYPNGEIYSCGAVPNTLGLYKYMGYETGKLKHYYRIADQKEYSIASITKKIIVPVEKDTGYRFEPMNSIEEVRRRLQEHVFSHVRPKKDYAYIQRKYFNNTGYTYDVLGIVQPGEEAVAGILVGREIQCNGAACFKIVDYIGADEELKNCGRAIQLFIDERGYEYVDFYETGIPDEIMQKFGFTLNEGADNIIPHYFEPFVQKNVDICYYASHGERFHGYRSDGGQERPNFIEDFSE